MKSKYHYHRLLIHRSTDLNQCESMLRNILAPCGSQRNKRESRQMAQASTDPNLLPRRIIKETQRLLSEPGSSEEQHPHPHLRQPLISALITHLCVCSAWD